MSQSSFESRQSYLPDIEINGIQNEACQRAVDQAIELLNIKLPASAQELVAGTEVTIADGLTESGGLAKAEEKKIILDATKNTLSLQAAEDFLVESGYLTPGDWVQSLPTLKDRPWSCLTYQLIHEFGHLIDGLSDGKSYERLGVQFSPTKYGETSPSESFAEAFSYWVFELDQAPEARQAVLDTLSIIDAA